MCPIGGAAEIYNIYRFNIDDFDLDSIDTADIIGSISGVNSTGYTDSNLNDNIYYCYGVSGVNSEGDEGPLSGILCEITHPQCNNILNIIGVIHMDFCENQLAWLVF